MVNDRLAITGAVWPSSAVTAAAKRRLGLVALPRGVAVSNVEDAEGDGGTRTMTTVTFNLRHGSCRRKAFSARLTHIDEARGEKKEKKGGEVQSTTQIHCRARSH